MTQRDPVEEIVDAVLYEGYMLYPYRPSAVKNRVRWTFGGVHPRAYSEEHGAGEAWQMQTECLVLPELECRLSVEIRFLHLLERIEAGHDTWQEATERRFRCADVRLDAIREAAIRMPVSLPAENWVEGAVTRRWQPIEAEVEITAPLPDGCPAGLHGADPNLPPTRAAKPLPLERPREQSRSPPRLKMRC